jgi:uncharacterized protein YjbI with pentapeptide repeats
LTLDHQRWLSSNGRFGKRLQAPHGIQIDSCDLEGMDFSQADLRCANFNGGSVRGARFVEANLSNAVFDSCDVEDADFGHADLSWAIFDTNHERASFDHADLTNTAWSADQGKQMHVERLQRHLLAIDGIARRLKLIS